MPHKLTSLVVLAAICLAQSTMVLAADGCEKPANSNVAFDCQVSRLTALDKRLNQAYKHALSLLPDNSRTDYRRNKEQLRRAQRAWLAFKVEHCAVEGAQEGGSNQWVSYYADECDAEMTEARIKFLGEMSAQE